MVGPKCNSRSYTELHFFELKLFFSVEPLFIQTLYLIIYFNIISYIKMEYDPTLYDDGTQGCKWVFTIHFADVETADFWCDQLSTVTGFAGSYGMAQVELAPSTGAVHVQGFVVLKSNMTKKALIARLKSWCTVPIQPWVARMKGTIEQCEKYCSKTDSRAPGCTPNVWGVRPENRQGSRTDLQTYVDALNQLPTDLPHQEKSRRLANVPELQTTFVKYHKGLAELARMKQTTVEKPIPTGGWRHWQQDLIERLDAPADDRTIVWVYDPEGKQGKSRLVLHYLSRKTGICLEGRIENMCFQFQGTEKVAFFDIPRGVATDQKTSGHLYTMAERLKNGFLNSTKYMPEVKIFDPPHVVYMSNSLPPEGVWSKDRLVQYTLLGPDSFEVYENQSGAENPPFLAESSATNGNPISTDTSSAANPFLNIEIPDNE